VLNVHAQTEDKIDDIKDRFCEELEQVFLQIPKVPNENFVRRFQCERRQGKYFQAKYCE
jgi:hypothetical protein